MEAFLGILAGAAIAISLIGAAISILMIVAQCRIFSKMGAPWWAALIPLFNTWVLCEKVVGHGAKMFILLIPIFGWFIYPFVLMFKQYKVLGKSTAFAILGLLFTPICQVIIAFDNSVYLGPC